MRVGYIQRDPRGYFLTDAAGEQITYAVHASIGPLFAIAHAGDIDISLLKVEIKQWNTYVTMREHCRVRNESDFYYEVRKELKRMGFDCIKKKPSSDGHMTDAPYYIRDAKRRWCMIDTHYAERDPAKEINTQRSLVLRNHWEVPTP